MNTTHTPTARRALAGLLAALLCSLLVACGGGEDEEDAPDRQPVDCRARPELCV